MSSPLSSLQSSILGTPPIETLPVELIAKVVEFIGVGRDVWPLESNQGQTSERKARKDLLSTLRISKDWTFYAEKQLWRRLDINSKVDANLCAGLPESDRRFTFIHQILVNTQFLGLDEIELQSGNDLSMVREARWRISSCSNDVAAFFSRLSSLGQVKSLRIDCGYTFWKAIRWSVTQQKSLEDLRYNLHLNEIMEEENSTTAVIPLHITRLDIEHSIFSNYYKPLDLFQLFGPIVRPNLKKLSLARTTSSQFLPLLPLLPSLEELRLSEFDELELLSIFPVHFRKLSFGYSNYLVKAFQKLDKRKYFPISYLIIEYDSYSKDDDFDYNTLSFIPAITELTIGDLETKKLANSLESFNLGELKFDKLIITVFEGETEESIALNWKRVIHACDDHAIQLEGWKYRNGERVKFY